MSAFGGKADIFQGVAKCPLIATSGHLKELRSTATPSPERTFELGENLDFKNSTFRGYKAVAKIILIEVE